MSEKIERETKEEIIKPDENKKIVVETDQTTEVREEPLEKQSSSTSKKLMSWLAVLVVILLVGVLGMWWIGSKQSAAANPEAGEKAETKKEGAEAGQKEGEKEGGGEEHGEEVKLEAETLASAGIEMEGVTSRPAIALLKTTGSIETNPQQTQSVSPLVGGRVENMSVRVGDYVRQGDLLAVIASPEIAEMQGKMREANIRLTNAQKSLERVQRAENRAAILQAKAKLDEAEATLRRTRRLIELGAGAGKDLVSAEANYKTAKADYDFQSNIPLNKEIQEARAEVETARVDLRHSQDQLRALGANPAGINSGADISRVPVRAPASGMITERPVNPGAGVTAGTTMLIISNLSSVYAVASVPQAEMSLIRIGTGAEISSPAIEGVMNARVTYIDPQLNEDTRTGRVRLEVPNPGNRLRAGMFVEVGFMTGTSQATGEELVVPSSAVQRIGEKTVVFVPVEDEPGTFKAKTVEVGGEVNGYTRIVSGVELNEKVVTKGSFTLKTVMQKGELGEHGH